MVVGAMAGKLSSMSGFAEARRAQAGLEVAVTLKSVNHRYLDLRWQMPGEWESLQPELEKQLRSALRRGHVDVRVSGAAQGTEPAAAGLNLAIVETYLAAHGELNRRLGAKQEVALPELLRFPGVLAANAVPGAAVARGAVNEAVQAAVASLQAMRQGEGAALGKDLRARLKTMAELRGQLAAKRHELEAGLLARLQTRMQALAGEVFASHPERLVQEAALLAERGDISEELTRLEAHLAAFAGLLDEGGEVGKRLDFLSQEMNREANTLLAKSTGGSAEALALAQAGVELKSEIEKMREQVQNLE